MTITYKPEGSGAADSDCTPATEFNEVAPRIRTDNTAISVTATNQTTDVRDIAWTTPANEPSSANWPSGDYKGSFEVAANPSDVSFKIELSRVNSSCTQQGGGPLGTSGALTGTGVKTFTVNTDPASGAVGDRYQCQILTSNSSHCDQTFTITVNDVDTFIEGAWVEAVWDQDSFRTRKDDGTDETDATWYEAANVDAIVPVDTTFRQRFVVQETAGGDAGLTQSLQIQYRKNNTGWTNITASSPNIKAVNSTKLTDGADTTQQVGGGTFLTDNNWVEDVDGVTDTSGVFAGNDEAEAEFALQIVGADVNGGDVIELRVVKAGGTVLDAYTNTPEVIVQVVFTALSDAKFSDGQSQHGPWSI